MPSPEKRQKPKKSPNSGGNPGNPRKWAKTEDTEQPKGRGRGKGKSPRPMRLSKRKIRPMRASCPPQGSRPCTGGVPLGGSKLERSLHRDRSTRMAPSNPGGLVWGSLKSGLCKTASLWYARSCRTKGGMPPGHLAPKAPAPVSEKQTRHLRAVEWRKSIVSTAESCRSASTQRCLESVLWATR